MVVSWSVVVVVNLVCEVMYSEAAVVTEDVHVVVTVYAEVGEPLWVVLEAGRSTEESWASSPV